MAHISDLPPELIRLILGFCINPATALPLTTTFVDYFAAVKSGVQSDHFCFAIFQAARVCKTWRGIATSYMMNQFAETNGCSDFDRSKYDNHHWNQWGWSLPVRGDLKELRDFEVYLRLFRSKFKEYEELMGVICADTMMSQRWLFT